MFKIIARKGCKGGRFSGNMANATLAHIATIFALNNPTELFHD